MSIQSAKILSKATELYLSDGLEAFSMRKLAKELGVTAPSLYRHYGSKEDVLLDVVEEAFKSWAAYLYRSLSGATPLERFGQAGQENLNFALEHPRWYEMLYVSPERLGWSEYPPAVAAHATATHQFWMDRVRECMDAGYLKDEDDPHAVGMTMWAHSHGLITIYLRGMLKVSEGEFRAMYHASGMRMMQGLGTKEFEAWSHAKMADEPALTP